MPAAREPIMSEQWMIRGTQFANCNCNWGCPCQFNSPTTHGHCEAIEAGHIEEGHYDGTRLDGLHYVMLVQWPGEIADGNGREQFIIDERADDAQRSGLEKILRGESTAPGSTHFYVFNSTMSEVLESIVAPIEMEIDVPGRTARIQIPGIGRSQAQPIIDPNSGQEFRASFGLPNGFQLTEAELGNGSTELRAGIELHLSNSHAHFARLHMNQDGVIR
jgi:hypothetical protein